MRPFLYQRLLIIIFTNQYNVANFTDSIDSKVDTAVEETAMVTDLRKICEEFSDDNIKVKIYGKDPCQPNLQIKLR